MAIARKLTTKIYEIQAHAQKVTCLDLGETGRVMVTGGQDRNVNLWQIGSTQCFSSLAGHNGQIDCVKFAYNDNYVYSADEHGIIKRWDLNGPLTACSTFYGHMKSVRTLDFHPYGELVTSGSNDTSVRLWDVRKDNACIDTFRGHIANVNSVRFSPDGSWIASAGTEGCLIIWDIRTRKKIIEFQEHASPITCIQFHPFEFLIAAGRNDGTVDLYDLESQKLISRTDGHSAFSGHTVKCVAFSESGECLFVGTAEGISVIGWEPDREFDHIEGSWSILGDMKVLTKKVYCAAYENQTVQIHDILVEQVIPFYNPSNQPFSYNQSSRKSFTRAGTAGQRMNLGGKKSGGGSPGKSVAKALLQQPLHGAIVEVPATSAVAGADRSSPSSLSFDMIEEEAPVMMLKNGFHFDTYAKRRSNSMFVGSPTSSTSEEPPGPHYGLDTPPSSMPLTLNDTVTLLRHDVDDDRHYIDHYASADLDYYPQRSGGMTASTVAEPEREDFPINSATPPDYAPKIDIVAHQMSKQQHKLKSTSTSSAVTHANAPLARRHSPPGLSTHQAPRVAMLSRKFAAHSMSTMDLHQASSDDSLPAVPRRNAAATGQTARNYLAGYAGSNNNHNHQNHHNTQHHHNNNNGNGAVKMRRDMTTTTASSSTTTTTSHYNRENNMRSKKISVQIYEAAPKAAPMRSKTSLDLRSGVNRTSAPTSPTTKRKTMYNAHNNHGSQQEESTYQMLAGQHEQIMGHLAQRLAMLRSLSRTGDVTETLRQAVKMNDASLLVDLFGVMLETNSVAWSLDLCTVLLPELYDMLRGVNTFHIERACNTLRHILDKFLPLIQENCLYGMHTSLGVDITAEERRKKCMECRDWLLHIKALPPDHAFLEPSDEPLTHRTGGLLAVQNLIDL